MEICEKVFTKCSATGKGAKSPNDMYCKIKQEDGPCPDGEDTDSENAREEEVQAAEQLKEAAGSNGVEGGTPKRSKSFADEAKTFLQVALSMLNAPASSPASGASPSGSGTATSQMEPSPHQTNPRKRAYKMLKQLHLKTETAIAAVGALKKDTDMLPLFLDGDVEEKKSVVAYQMGVEVDKLWPKD